MKLSKDFYRKLDEIIKTKMVAEDNADIIKKIDWNKEADRCLDELKNFFKELDVEELCEEIEDETIGVVDVRWNEYGGDIEIDFMPDNDFNTAFDQGCIINSSAVDNDDFFMNNFNCTGEESYEKIDGDYPNLIFVFHNLFLEIVPVLIKDSHFIDLPKKTPYYMSFAFSHDDEKPEVLFTNKVVDTENHEVLRKKILETFKAYADKKHFNTSFQPVSNVLFLGIAEYGFDFSSMVSNENGDEIFNTMDNFNLSSFFEDGSDKNIEDNFDRAADVLTEILKKCAITEEFQSIPKNGSITFELKLIGVKKKVLCSINPDGKVNQLSS